ncbi:type I restriction-modification system subunit M/S [Haloactinomyces albus]|uniref:Type I restriction enzyme M protein n=1 Tax=Haloactinomyces albus TaxID=1352928 RepID=A0AAE4CPT5_9ACTN|nr:N-6 DNA methylase [Haloactinomyces albus]MDR7302038.1 type I restriction enzyme M protein [Haloactinomyces albus]
MNASEDRVSMAEIGRLAEVKPAAVSNWRRRSTDFPEPASTTGGEQFAVGDVAAWLDGRRIPKNALKAGESAGTTYGERLRRNLDSAGTAVPWQPKTPKTPVRTPRDFFLELWRELDGYRGYLTAPFYRDLVLGLLYLRVRDTSRWRELVAASSGGDPHRIRDMLAQAVSDHRLVLPDLVDLVRLDSHGEVTGLNNIIRLLDQVQAQDTMNSSGNGAHQLFESLLEQLATTDRSYGEFYTPDAVVRTMLELVEPHSGEKVHDPCCGVGSLLTGTVKFVRRNDGDASDPSISGHALAETSRKLAAMSLSVLGTDADLGDGPVHALRDAPEGGHGFDVIVSNPPFNMKSWSRTDTSDDPRWHYGTPPDSNANFAWLQHSLARLAPGGRAAVLMGNGATFHGGRNREIRAAMIEDGAVEAIIALPPQLFHSTGIPVSIWLLKRPTGRNREEVLLVDATGMGRMVERTRCALDDEDIERIGSIHREFRKSSSISAPGFCRAVPLSEIREREYLLNPRSYLGDPAATVEPSEVRTAAREHRRNLAELASRLSEIDAEVEQQLGRKSSWTPLVDSTSPTWERVPLGEVCDVLAGPSGEVLRALESHAEGIPLLAPKNIHHNRVIDTEVDRVESKNIEKKLTRYRLSPGDVLCVRTGEPGRPALIGEEHAGSLFSTACFRLRPKEAVLTGPYLTYWLGTPPAREWISRNTLGATVPSLNARMLRSMPVALPPLRVQEAIEEVLGSLDDKIALHEEIGRITAELRDSLAALLGSATFPLLE